MGFLVVGGVVTQAGVLAPAAGIMRVLGLLVPHRRSASIVGLVIYAVGASLMVKGANTLRRGDPAPRETVETLEEDREWLKNQTNG